MEGIGRALYSALGGQRLKKRRSVNKITCVNWILSQIKLSGCNKDYKCYYRNWFFSRVDVKIVVFYIYSVFGNPE